MKTKEEEIDKIIYEALGKEEAAFYDELGEQSLLDMSLGVFKGRNKVPFIIALIMSFVILGIFIYCAIQFYNAQTTREMLLFGGIGFWCLICILGIKLWHWMQMNTNRMLREMKRLELQVSALASKK